ncbi:MAG: hypothetical protein EHM48_02960 [Planctomycetaceae bacterium]|nr:MAG: hypothetical protein EHM48_02960 [Planctomycetaceae bacterium]
MAISDSIATTMRRIGLAGGLLGGPTIRKLWQGLSREFGRVWDYLGIVQCATVPSSSLCIEALSDLEAKYGIASLGDLTDDERIARLVERASQYGSGGAGWLQQQIQAAGFPLYVIENLYTPGIETQLGLDTQLDITTQLGTLPSRIDPSTVPGLLITSSASRTGSKVLDPSSQLGSMQLGTGITSQLGSRDEDYSYPQPATRNLPVDASRWAGVFFLSPFPDRLASEDEMLFIAEEKVAYLVKLVTAIKYLGRWCVAQVAQRVVMVTELDEALTMDDGSTWTT